MKDMTRSMLESLRPSVFPDPVSQTAFKAQLRLADTEWFARDRLQQHQLIDLKKVVSFAASEIPFWRARLDVDAVLKTKHLADALALLPTLSRGEVLDNRDALRATALPSGHAVIGELKTSGSTGGVVSIHTTNV